MYKVDRQDRVERLTGFPQSDIGAPVPVVVAGEHTTVVTYYVQNTPDGWDDKAVISVRPDTKRDLVASIVFRFCYGHIFGPPNDEAFEEHPLSSRGLEPYDAFEILDSSWIRSLVKMNSVHPYHDKSKFLQSKRHFILSFHDSTFECIAESYETVMGAGSVLDVSGTVLGHLK